MSTPKGGVFEKTGQRRRVRWHGQLCIAVFFCVFIAMSAEGFARAFPQWSVHEISQVMLTLPHPVDTDSLLSVLCARQVDDVHLAHFLNQDTPIYPFLPPFQAQIRDAPATPPFRPSPTATTESSRERSFRHADIFQRRYHKRLHEASREAQSRICLWSTPSARLCSGPFYVRPSPCVMTGSAKRLFMWHKVLRLALRAAHIAHLAFHFGRLACLPLVATLFRLALIATLVFYRFTYGLLLHVFTCAFHLPSYRIRIRWLISRIALRVCAVRRCERERLCTVCDSMSRVECKHRKYLRTKPP